MTTVPFSVAAQPKNSKPGWVGSAGFEADEIAAPVVVVRAIVPPEPSFS